MNMEPEKYNDEMIETMLEDSFVEAPEDISTEVVKALPSIRRKKTLSGRAFWSRRKTMMAAFVYMTIVIILMILFTIATVRVYKGNLSTESRQGATESIDKK